MARLVTLNRNSNNALIVLVRHGQSEGNTTGILSRNHETLPLTSKGVQQAEAVSKELNKLKVEIIVSSPLLRARQTAEIIAERIGLGFTMDTRLQERDFGQLEGTLADSYRWRFEKGKGIETLDQIFFRVKSFMDDVYDGVLVGVTHGDTMKAPILKLLGLDEISGFGVRNYNTNMTIIQKTGSTYELIGFGLPVLTNELLKRIPQNFKSK